MSIFRRRPRNSPQAAAPTPGAASSTSPLSEAEQQWLRELLGELAADGVDPSDPVQLGAYYDAAYARWSQVEENERPDPNPIINRIGAGLGACLASRTGLEWVVATDAYGTELALHGQPGDVLLFPPNLVAKRWVAGETGFLPGLVDFCVAQAESLRGRR